ncbi:MAG TPA: hypothetical protein DG048_23770 [Pseudoalteromonas sp.]|jgi:hypothetical protein|nr:hypothetical protein [Pseudoalteromonas sp.]|tara:strand:+ start:8587 stop:8778 length:192 start_codon:yes stop_codon:yes gene_type:complete
MFKNFDFASAQKPLPKLRGSSSMEGMLRSVGGIDVVEKVDRVMDQHPDLHIKCLEDVISEVNE